MTIMPGVDWRPSPNFSSPVRRPPRGIVLHIAQGSYDGTVGWQANAAAQVSSYFVNGRDGRLAQCVDLDHKAWTQGTGNEAWIGIENEGSVPDALTDAQINNIARIWAWMHSIWPTMKIQVTDDPVNGEGIGWHGMGASIGWGHPDCPGEAIKAQRPLIVQRTLELIGGAHPSPIATEDEVAGFRHPNQTVPHKFRGVSVDLANKKAISHSPDGKPVVKEPALGGAKEGALGVDNAGAWLCAVANPDGFSIYTWPDLDQYDFHWA